MSNYILKPDQVPENSIIIAHNPDLEELELMVNKLENYLETCISHNETSGQFRLHLIYKLQMRVQGESYNQLKERLKNESN